MSAASMSTQVTFGRPNLLCQKQFRSSSGLCQRLQAVEQAARSSLTPCSLTLRHTGWPLGPGSGSHTIISCGWQVGQVHQEGHSHQPAGCLLGRRRWVGSRMPLLEQGDVAGRLAA